MTHTYQQQRDIASNKPLWYGYTGNLKKAIDVADFYGFKLTSPLTIEKEDRAHEKRHHCPAQHIAALRSFITDEVHRGGTVRLAHTRRVPYKKDIELRLEIIGDKESSAEGLLFQTAQSILNEYGHKNITASINSIGARESVALFTQALANYFRPRLGDLETPCREAFKENTFAPMHCKHQKCIDARADAPQSLNYLSEPSRRHFKEVLEYLESLGISYTVDPTHVGSEHYSSRTIFSFADALNDTLAETPLVFGERYDHLAKKLGMRKSIPALQATFFFNTESPREKITVLKRAPREASVYLIQVGLQAKIRALIVGEDLRRAHIRVTTTLHKNSVCEQMDEARGLGVPFVVIIGQREVCEGTALVRHITTNQQQTVPLSQLSVYLKDRVRRA